MEASFEERSCSDRGIEQAIIALKKGAHLLKCGKRGKPKLCPFRLSTDEKLLVWYSADKEKNLELSSVSNVLLGQKTVNFLRQRRPEKEPQSLSLIYDNGECSIDLVRSLYSSPRCNQSRYFQHSILEDSSEIFFSPRLRQHSEIESFLEKFIPHLQPNIPKGTKNAVQTDVTRDWKMSRAPKLKLPDQASLSIDRRSDNLKDIFMWGKVPGAILENAKGTKCDPSLPRLLDSVQTFQIEKIICGETHAALVTKQGEVFSWGEEKGGRLGHKTNINISNPKIIESLSNLRVNTLALGANHTCALTTSGEIYEWGESSNGDKKIPWFPYRICGGPLDGICISKVACGNWHTAIISSSGTLYTYGEGTFGVLGHGDKKSITKPKEVESLKGLRVKSVACGPWHTAAIVEIIVGSFKSSNPGGKLFTWGDSDRGRLGHTDREKKLIPTCVASLVDCDFVQVACGTVLTAALTVSGMVFTMGSAMHGQLGNPRARDGSITCVDGLLKTEFVKEIASGSFHVAILTSNGRIFTWGKGSDGQLGLGDLTDRSAPAFVDTLEDRKVESIACGSNFTAAVCLHRSISSRDQSVCTGCKTVFGFTRKKHNCYNCGSTFCHACSGNKALKAALAPDRGRRYRVCDQCFSQLENYPGSMLNKGNLTVRAKRVEQFLTEIRAYTPKVSRIFKEASLNEENVRSTKNVDQKRQHPANEVLGPQRRWGQVDCPVQFVNCFSETSCFYSSTKQKAADMAKEVESDPSPTDVPESESEVALVDKILSEEIRQLGEEVSILFKQCQQKSLKIQQFKRKIEETWSFSRDEAANCKALDDVIKLLSNQKDVLSEKLSAKEAHSVNETMCRSSSIKALDERAIVDICTTSIDHTEPTNSSLKNQKNARIVIDRNASEVIEQIERGIYFTFIALPGGKKGLKTVRFSRKHFNEEQAKIWWDKHGATALLKYNVEETAT
ncbi:regulator of chromosome condensation (RCC1) family with FYVE zinc finger domain-containing protein isoform X3 [Carex rostrata]